MSFCILYCVYNICSYLLPLSSIFFSFDLSQFYFFFLSFSYWISITVGEQLGTERLKSFGDLGNREARVFMKHTYLAMF